MSPGMIITAIENAEKQSLENGLDRIMMTIEFADKVIELLKEPRTGAQLFLRDNYSGTVHKYGDNKHDSLILEDDGSLHYYNLQNGCGTMFPEEGYSFCLMNGSSPEDEETGIRYLDIGGAAVGE